MKKLLLISLLISNTVFAQLLQNKYQFPNTESFRGKVKFVKFKRFGGYSPIFSGFDSNYVDLNSMDNSENKFELYFDTLHRLVLKKVFWKDDDTSFRDKKWIYDKFGNLVCVCHFTNVCKGANLISR